MLFDFSSAFNRTQPATLMWDLEEVGVDRHLAALTTDCLTNRPQYVTPGLCLRCGIMRYSALSFPFQPLQFGLQSQHLELSPPKVHQ